MKNNKHILSEDLFLLLKKKLLNSNYRIEKQSTYKRGDFRYCVYIDFEYGISQSLLVFNDYNFNIDNLLYHCVVTLKNINSFLIMHRDYYSDVSKITIDSIYELYNRHLLIEIKIK